MEKVKACLQGNILDGKLAREGKGKDRGRVRNHQEIKHHLQECAEHPLHPQATEQPDQSGHIGR